MAAVPAIFFQEAGGAKELNAFFAMRMVRTLLVAALCVGAQQCFAHLAALAEAHASQHHHEPFTNPRGHKCIQSVPSLVARV